MPMIESGTGSVRSDTFSRRGAETMNQLHSEMAGDHLLERSMVEVLVKHALPRRRDRSIFLGNDDDERVALLSDAQGRAMPRPVSELRVFRRREREERAGDDNPIATDDDGTVMQRPARREDAHEQLRRDERIDWLGHIFVRAERLGSFDRDERADGA
jgi:hypothetical protein